MSLRILLFKATMIFPNNLKIYNPTSKQCPVTEAGKPVGNEVIILATLECWVDGFEHFYVLGEIHEHGAISSYSEQAARASENWGVVGAFPCLLSQHNTFSDSCKMKKIFFLYSVKAGLAMKLCARILKIKSTGWIAAFRSSPSHWVAEMSRRYLKYPLLSIHVYPFNPHVFYSSLLYIICVSDMNL